MSKPLLVIAGVVNLLFVGFHLFLGYQIHRSTGLSAGVQGLLETFNATGTLSIAMLGCAFLARSKEVLGSGLGAILLAYGALLYLSRAAAEFIWMTGNLKIASVCVAVGLLHAVLLLGVRVVRQST
jgi:hypothetical protein